MARACRKFDLLAFIKSFSIVIIVFSQFELIAKMVRCSKGFQTGWDQEVFVIRLH
jgi:hypothetical protein